MTQSLPSEELLAVVLTSDKRAPSALKPRIRTRYSRFMYQGYRVTAFSVELASDMFRQFQAAFTIEGHAEDAACSTKPDAYVFDTHNNALRYARADAKRFIRALNSNKGRGRSPLELDLVHQQPPQSDPLC